MLVKKIIGVFLFVSTFFLIFGFVSNKSVLALSCGQVERCRIDNIYTGEWYWGWCYGPSCDSTPCPPGQYRPPNGSCTPIADGAGGSCNCGTYGATGNCIPCNTCDGGDIIVNGKYRCCATSTPSKPTLISPANGAVFQEDDVVKVLK